MKVIVQEEPYGCGFASVANLLGLTYLEVKAKANSMGISADDERLFSNTDYVRRLLESYSVQIGQGEQKFVSWNSLPNESLLAIKYREERGNAYWHWVVFKRIRGNPVVLDSSPSIDNHERYDFENMNPKWFIEVIHSKR